MAIAGNNCDMYECEQISYEEVDNYAKELGAIFKYVSSKNNLRIKELFEEIGKKFLMQNGIKSVDKSKGFKLEKNKTKTKAHKNC